MKKIILSLVLMTLISVSGFGYYVSHSLYNNGQIGNQSRNYYYNLNVPVIYVHLYALRTTHESYEVARASVLATADNIYKYKNVSTRDYMKPVSFRGNVYMAPPGVRYELRVECFSFIKGDYSYVSLRW